MPYIESITRAGRTIEVERYYSNRYGSKGQRRADKVKPTPEDMVAINNRHAEKKLRRLINENFGAGDYHLVLSYQRNKGDPHRTPEEMRDDAARFMRALRREYKKLGKELKYIHVPEVGTKGARHHHLIVNQIPPDIIQRCWPHGRININPLDQSGQYKDLASYLVKYSSKAIRDPAERISGKRWNASKNLRHPISKKRIISSRAFFRTEPRIPPRLRGKAYIDADSVAVGIHSAEYYGYGFMRYTIILRC